MKNAKVDSVLNQAALEYFKEQSNKSESILKEFDGIDYKIETIGRILDMKYSKNFEDQVLEFMSNVNDFMKEMKEDVKEIKSLPTIQKELKIK